MTWRSIPPMVGSMTRVATGSSDDMALVVTNTGTAPLADIKLTASTPKGWQVTFDPETIPDLQPAAAAQVSANIAPAGNAVAGDYALTVTASSPTPRVTSSFVPPSRRP